MSSKKDSGNLSVMPPPKHIAIIMDGNGRWAKSRHLPRSSGHQKGVQTVRKIVKHCAKLGVNTLTLFAFSSENMKRSRDEVGLLFKLFLSVLKTETGKLKELIDAVKIHGSISKSELYGHMGWGRGIKWTPYRRALLSHPNIYDTMSVEPTYNWKE